MRDVIEKILFRRGLEHKLEGYTLDTSDEITEALKPVENMSTAQARHVMPLIGPLLDAWEGTANDFKSDVLDQYPTLHDALQDIHKAVEQD